VGVLDGIKVVDLTMWAFVPSAGGVLAQWGADVIKVEGPNSPDPCRVLAPGTLEPGRASRSFRHYNRGKRAIAIDLARPEGTEVLHGLVKQADVFLTSFLPVTRKKLKFDVEDVQAVNPSIVYAKGSGHGPLGPESERRGYDAAVWWARGSLADSAMATTGAEWPTGMIGHGDSMSGMTLAGGICAALVQRARTGRGSIVDGSLLATAVWFNHQPILASVTGESYPSGVGDRRKRPAAMNSYRTKDGRFLSLVFVNDPDPDWADLCRHLGREDLATDPRFATAKARAENCGDAVDIFDAIFAERAYEEWKSALATVRGVWEPVQKASEMHDDPQVIANGYLQDIEYPTGKMALPSPILFDQDAGQPQRAPDHGQHTDEILRELGIDDQQIARYRTSGVVA
jgi:crotonobetainyl-CoA:carnitine CoA-transferase CaiB-like acyl-CoA transferase